MLKYVTLAILCGWRLIFDYFTWILRYSIHPNKYPIEVRYKKARSLIRFVFKTWKVCPNVTNIEYLNNNDKSFLALCNHRAAIDPLMLIFLSEKPLSFVAKNKIKKYPFVGRILTAIDGKFIDRDNVFSQVEIFRDIAKAIESNKISYLIFPEGKRNRDLNGQVLPFHNGTIKPAYWSKCDILLASMCGTENMQSAKIHYKKYPVEIKFIEFVKYNDFKDKTTSEITPILEEKINTSLNEVRAKNYNDVAKIAVH